MGVIITTFDRYAAQERVEVARQALKDVHGLEYTTEVLEFVFNKMEACVPSMLQGVPRDQAGPSQIWPALTRCADCHQEFGSHRRKVPLVLYSSSSGKEAGTAVEQHCNACGEYFLGQWSYRRHDRKHGSAISALRLVSKQCDRNTFLIPMPGIQTTYGCTIHDLILIGGNIHHARGSFHAAAEIMADTSGDAELGKDSHANEVLEALWFSHALHTSLPDDQVFSCDWGTFWTGQRISDDWLLQRKADIRAHFAFKWTIQHPKECAHCLRCFAIGLDGKRGWKRFLCASLDGQPLEIPEVDAWLAQGCCRRAAYGSLYCYAHDHCSSAEDAQDASQVRKHRSTESGLMEYYSMSSTTRQIAQVSVRG